jgi:hypothetical protein
VFHASYLVGPDDVSLPSSKVADFGQRMPLLCELQFPFRIKDPARKLPLAYSSSGIFKGGHGVDPHWTGCRRNIGFSSAEDSVHRKASPSAMKLVHILMLIGSSTIVAAAFAVRRYIVDFCFLLFAGLVFFGCTLLMLTADGVGPLHGGNNNPAIALGMLVSFYLLYPTALALGIRFFFTPVRGWVRAIYLLAAIIGLSPLIMLALIAVIFVVGGALQ